MKNLHKIVNGIELKHCSVCKEWFDLSLFYRDRRTSDGLTYKCKKCDSIRGKKYGFKNREKNTAYQKKWRKVNKERLDKKAKERNKTDLKYKLNKNISSAIRHSLKNGKEGNSWKSLVSYTVDDLKRHLEKRFTKGMTWQLFLEGKIHIDHKIPKSVFNYTNPNHEDFKKCWALKNLQPMWAKENYSKGAKLTKHFQPSLLI